MIKPPNIPGATVVTDTLDFVKNLWGSMNVPGVTLQGMAAPTLSVEELDKKISDLKAVESWLNLNMGMLRGSIQALEVQRGTIVTLKAMGATLSNAVRPAGEDKGNERSILDAIPYASAFLFPNANPVPTTPDEMQANIEAQMQQRYAAPEPEVSDEENAADEDAAEKPASIKPPDFGAQLAQAGAWWGVLQEQFKQAVSSALAANSEKLSSAASKVAAAASAATAMAAAPERARSDTKSGAKSNPKPRAKPAASKTGTTKASTKATGAAKKTVSARSRKAE